MSLITVIVGAGTKARTFGENLPEIIYAIEPEKENFKLLIMLRTTYFETQKTLIPVRMALSNTIGEGELYTTRHSDGHSLKERLLEQPEPVSLTGETETVPLCTWDNFIDMFDIKHVDYCQVDIEGSEREFLEGMTTVFPDYILLSAYHHLKFKDAATDTELYDMLVKKGYQVVKINHENLWGVKRG